MVGGGRQLTLNKQQEKHRSQKKIREKFWNAPGTVPYSPGPRGKNRDHGGTQVEDFGRLEHCQNRRTVPCKQTNKKKCCEQK